MDGPKRIDGVYAYIVEREDGTEEVPVLAVPEWDNHPGPVLMPLVSVDEARTHALRRYIFAAPELAGKKLLLTKFTGREVVEVLKR